MMMRTATPVRQYLATAFLITIGLMGSGCGDTGTVNPVVELASLTVTPGTLQPAFSGGTTQYRVQVTTDITSVRITAQPAVAGDTVTINGQLTTSRDIPLGEQGSTTPVNIVVSETDTNSRTYTVLITRAGLAGNNSLASLTVSSGSLAPDFNANTTSYTVDVANNVGSITVTPTLSDPAATMTVNGTPATSGVASTVPLNNPGQNQNTVIPIVVTAQNSNVKTYTVTVTRGVSGNNNLRSLTVSPGSLNPSFSAGTEGYTVNVASTVASVTVTPTLQDTSATMRVNGQPATSGQARPITLNGAGSNTFINIVVTAQNNTQKIYSINIIRAVLGGNNNLSGLTVSPGSLSPAFNAETENYTVNVASSVSSVTITPRLQDTTASMTVNGQPTNSGQARTMTLNGAGSNTVINIVVTAPNGSRNPYTVNVNRAALGGNNNLSGLTVSPGTLAPAFNGSTTSYTVDVGSGVTSVTVTPTRQDSAATITVNGQAATSGQGRSITLNGAGSNTLINVVVTAQNGAQRTYSVTVNRAALGGNNNLSGLTVSPGTLSPSFSAGTEDYTVNVASTVTSVTVTPRLQDTAATMSVNGQSTNSGQDRSITLNGAGSNTVINIVVTAQNGTQKTYSVTVNRAALGGNNNLSALSVSPGTLTPAFSASTTNYTVDVGSGVSSVTVTPTRQDSAATITVNGQAATSGQGRSITLNEAGSDTGINIVVTAANGNSKTYTITVERAAPASNNNLSALSVTPGSMSPAFSAGTTAYTVNVATDVTSVTVTATLADTNSTMTIEGQGNSSGQARSITLGAAGTSTAIDIIVTAPNGSSKTYTITVNRAASEPTEPPAPGSAPDLIPQDDSGLLPGQDADNITNVTTPRFRISQPGSGETASLYVDGNKVSATFDSAANTLRPTAALSDGEHQITYTVTNAGGESPPSPSLTITIDTSGPGTPQG